MNKVYLLIGGNVGSREAYLGQAIHMINDLAGRVVQQSSMYETAAWGITDQPAFLNQAVEIETNQGAYDLMGTLLKIEEKIGRKRTEKYGPRTIDIDMLFFNDEIINSSLVTVPHPQLHNRRFALEPLCEIAPGMVHPLLRKNIQQLLAECADTLPVNKI